MAVNYKLYLVRHAIAEERGEDWPDDTQRPLTSTGKTRMRRQMAGLRALGVDIDLVLTSPLVRAAQTADILIAGLKHKPRRRVFRVLAPGHAPGAIAKALAAHRAHHTIALVGHEPGLGQLAAWFLGARTPPLFKKGGVARIDFTDWPPGRNGQLIWWATPRLLRGR